MAEEEHARGVVVARALAGAWRKRPPPLELSDGELRAVRQNLVDAGATALVWRRLATGGLAGTAAGELLRDAYRSLLLRAAVDERDLVHALGAFAEAGLDVLLLKGWSVSRLYPEPGIRPSGDIDFCVPSGQEPLVPSAVERAQQTTRIDFHPSVAKLGVGRITDLFARSVLTQIAGVDVRIPSPEDTLRIVSVHLLGPGHAAWRPLWLCDVAVCLESRPDDFDWSVCLGGDPRLTQRVRLALELAHRLLGADLTGVPRGARVEKLPHWLSGAVLAQWGRPGHPYAAWRVPMATYVRTPRGVAAAVRSRWPNPIEATVATGAPFSDFPRLPLQLAYFLQRAGRSARQMPGALRRD
jgi:hypothetical protein